MNYYKEKRMSTASVIQQALKDLIDMFQTKLE